MPSRPGATILAGPFTTSFGKIKLNGKGKQVTGTFTRNNVNGTLTGAAELVFDAFLTARGLAAWGKIT